MFHYKKCYNCNKEGTLFFWDWNGKQICKQCFVKEKNNKKDYAKCTRDCVGIASSTIRRYKDSTGNYIVRCSNCIKYYR